MVQLCRAVEQWEPRTETVAVHAWLHPWLPYLGSHMDQVYPTIRFKLSAALQQWHPSDQSALALLRPWRTVLFAPPPTPLSPLAVLSSGTRSTLQTLLLEFPWPCQALAHVSSPHPLPLLTLVPSLKPDTQYCRTHPAFGPWFLPSGLDMAARH